MNMKVVVKRYTNNNIFIKHSMHYNYISNKVINKKQTNKQILKN